MIGTRKDRLLFVVLATAAEGAMFACTIPATHRTIFCNLTVFRLGFDNGRLILGPPEEVPTTLFAERLTVALPTTAAGWSTVWNGPDISTFADFARLAPTLRGGAEDAPSTATTWYGELTEEDGPWPGERIVLVRDDGSPT